MQRTCQSCKKEFNIEPDDQVFYEKMQVPPPTWCWECRAQRRLAFRNESALFKRKSDMSGEMIFSMFQDNVPFPVYSNEEWYSDTWDPFDYGRDYDFSRSFFEQLKELIDVVPRATRSVLRLENSDYSNNASSLKNCYLLFNSNASEDCLFGNGVDDSRGCVDGSHIMGSEACYQCFWVTRCNRAFYSVQCEDSYDIWFSKNLTGCSNCFGCMNLRNKSYCVFNEQYSKEEYEQKIKEFNLQSYTSIQDLKQKAESFWLTQPNKYMQGVKNEDVSGEYIFNSKNVHYSYLVRESKDLKYCQYLQIGPNENCYDLSVYGDGCTDIYEAITSGENCNNIKFCIECYLENSRLEYCVSCRNSSDCFGCVSLRNAQYCIFNKQYTKEQYEELVLQIKKQMQEITYRDEQGRVYAYGEFFPPSFSPYSYEDTIAQQQIPLKKEQARELGYRWFENEDTNHTVTVQGSDLPDTIDGVDDDILQQVIGCERSGKAYRIVGAELNFYRQHKLPLPRLHPTERMKDRFKYRSTFQLYQRTTEDGQEVLTAYSPDRPERILSEEGYQNEVV